MKNIIKKIIPKFILDYRQKNFEKKLILEWRNHKGDKAPPHIVKQLHIKNLKNAFNTEVLVETGTYLGAMVKAQSKSFKKIYTVEISEELYPKTKQELKYLKNVDFILGDSGEVLQALAKKITEPALFWLDGHYWVVLPLKAA